MGAHHVDFIRDLKFRQGRRCRFDFRPVAVAAHEDADEV